MKEECFDLDLYTWTKVEPTDEVSQRLFQHPLFMHMRDFITDC